jgi:hypothetical protein
VSRSSTEAEYRALPMLTAELYWLRMLFKELHVPLPTVPKIWCDNVGALALASNLVYHAWTKHIEVDYHFICEKVLNKDISLHYLSLMTNSLISSPNVTPPLVSYFFMTI